MKIGIIKEKTDNRVAIVPELVKKLIAEGNEIIAEKGCGETALFTDESYTEAGARLTTREEVLSSSEMIATIVPLENDECKLLASEAIVISSYAPYHTLDATKAAAVGSLTVFSMDMIPRITLAQAMDVLSSMASIAGYKAVILAANHLPKYFPMLTTAAGSIPPAKILVMGAGVAGLQAVATAKRLGAVVLAFDTRLAAKEEVESLGAKFVEVEGAKDDKTAGGYAVEQTEEYKQKQRERIFEEAVKADVIITTAQLRGKAAPILITKEMVEKMKVGSVIVDIASSTGGNCALTEDGKTVVKHGVTIIGNSELAADVPNHASQLFSRNVHNFIKIFLKDGKPQIDLENVILKSSCIISKGEIIYGN
jgi:H+-translocating NAD(P) transhydrogenase subunit alpha